MLIRSPPYLDSISFHALPMTGEASVTDQPKRPLLPLLMFDHDGVICDSLEVFAPALIEGCSRARVPGVTSEGDVLALYEGNVYERLARAGATPEAVRQAVDWANAALQRAVPSLHPFREMPQVLNALTRIRHVVIVTSNAESVVSAFLELHHIEGVYVVGAESGHSKVDKIGRLMARHPDQERIWFVSDTAGDMLEARRAGVTPLGVAWGWHEPWRLEEAGAAVVVESPARLLSIVAPELPTSGQGAEDLAENRT